MTHDELLAKIDEIISIGYAQEGFAEYAAEGTKAEKALRAVVELHYAKSSEYFEGDVCETCSWDLDYYTPYPCPTIKAITKELE